MHREATANSLRGDQLTATLSLRRNSSMSACGAQTCSDKRARELQRGVGERLLVTFAEVPLPTTPPSAGIDFPMCAIRTPARRRLGRSRLADCATGVHSPPPAYRYASGLCRPGRLANLGARPRLVPSGSVSCSDRRLAGGRIPAEQECWRAPREVSDPGALLLGSCGRCRARPTRRR